MQWPQETQLEPPMVWPPSHRTRGCSDSPVDGERFIHLIVLACLDTTAAEDALVRIVAIKRIGVVLFVGLGFVGVLLVFYLQIASCVVHGAVAVTVVADRAVEHVIAEDDIKSFMLGGFRPY